VLIYKHVIETTIQLFNVKVNDKKLYLFKEIKIFTNVGNLLFVSHNWLVRLLKLFLASHGMNIHLKKKLKPVTYQFHYE
jgi:hypothetical protein